MTVTSRARASAVPEVIESFLYVYIKGINLYYIQLSLNTSGLRL